jgi:hypothetical protein
MLLSRLVLLVLVEQLLHKVQTVVLVLWKRLLHWVVVVVVVVPQM